MVSKLEFILNSGHSMPYIGLGTYQIGRKEDIFRVVDAALKFGYRLFDTANVYGNEEYIGEALKEFLPKYNLSREDIFITSKLSPHHHGYSKALNAVDESLTKLKIAYLDLFLIHWPGKRGLASDDTDNVKYRAESWKALITAQKNGLVRSIGVSNYTVRHLQELMQYSGGVLPSVNQVEFHPHYKQIPLLNFCRQHNILIQAYCSLGGSSSKTLIEDENVKRVASSVNRSPVQVLLRWALQQEVAIIPKSVSPERIAMNIDLDFTLGKSDMDVLNNISFKHKYSWDPEKVV